MNLSPASRRKGGASFDLAIAMALLGAAGLCRRDELAGSAFAGELGLDGALRPVAGALPTAMAAARAGLRRIIVAKENAREAAVCERVEVFAAASLAEALAMIRDARSAERVRVDTAAMLGGEVGDGVDFGDVRGQPAARRALEIAAAGEHTSCWSGRQAAARRCSRGDCFDPAAAGARRGDRDHVDLQRRGPQPRRRADRASVRSVRRITRPRGQA